MKKNKLIPLLALGAVVAVLGGALAALKLSATEETADAGIALCGVDAAAADTIHYKTDSMDITLHKAENDSWTLESDPLLPIDQSKADVIAADLAGLTAARELGSGAEVDAMGFDAPQMELTLAAGDTSATITVGAKNTMTDSYYVRTDAADSVYTVATTNLASLCKSEQDLYAPQDITDIEIDDVAEMTVETGTETLHFTQTDGTWALAGDAAYTPDQSLVTRMASTVCALQSSWSITAPAADGTYGLDNPNVTVTLRSTSGETVACRFGAADPADAAKCYLSATGAQGVVYEVSADNLSAFAYTKATLQAATAETAQTDTADIIAEQPVGGSSDYAN